MIYVDPFLALRKIAIKKKKSDNIVAMCIMLINYVVPKTPNVAIKMCSAILSDTELLNIYIFNTFSQI